MLKAMWLFSKKMLRACTGSCSSGDLDLCALCVGTRAGGKQPEAGLKLTISVDARASDVLLAVLRQWLGSSAFGLCRASLWAVALGQCAVCAGSQAKATASSSQQLHLGGESGECCTISTHKHGLCAAPCKQSSAQSVLKAQLVDKPLQQLEACQSPLGHQTRGCDLLAANSTVTPEQGSIMHRCRLASGGNIGQSDVMGLPRCNYLHSA